MQMRLCPGSSKKEYNAVDTFFLAIVHQIAILLKVENDEFILFEVTTYVMLFTAML